MKINHTLKKILKSLMVSGVSGIFLSACSPNPSNQTPETTLSTKTITGVVQERFALKNAQIFLVDAQGKQYSAHTNSQGIYNIALDSASETPFKLAAVSEGGKLEDCVRNDVLRPICLVSVVTQGETSTHYIGNINSLTDRVSSDIAKVFSLIGPQQLFNSNEKLSIFAEQESAALRPLQESFRAAIKEIGIANSESFNPATFNVHEYSQFSELLSLINHNRNYDNTSGEAGHATLSDISFRPLVGLTHGGNYEEFDFVRAKKEAQKIKNAKIRIFIVGDSTSSMYEKLRAPRMGWGKAFADLFADNPEVAVVVGSRAGRSSRDFYHGRWFAQMEPWIQSGDYVFINHGHNDQNCDSAREIRGTPDVKNLCTYPDSVNGAVQHPDKQPELSFRNSLLRYIHIAQEKGAHPILFTPTTRILNKDRKQQLPVAHSHFIANTKGKNYAFVGDYSNTIKELAKRENIPLLDLESKTIEFANQLGEHGWKDYWLVIDPAINAYYANGMAGSTSAPDGTHFQAKGAKVVADMVLQAIQEKPELNQLTQIITQ